MGGWRILTSPDGVSPATQPQRNLSSLPWTTHKCRRSEYPSSNQRSSFVLFTEESLLEFRIYSRVLRERQSESSHSSQNPQCVSKSVCDFTHSWPCSVPLAPCVLHAIVRPFGSWKVRWHVSLSSLGQVQSLQMKSQPIDLARRLRRFWRKKTSFSEPADVQEVMKGGIVAMR